MASLDHSLWIHRGVSLDQWLLFHKRTSTAQGSRGMVHSEFFGENGTLVASMTQERKRRDASNARKPLSEKIKRGSKCIAAVIPRQGRKCDRLSLHGIGQCSQCLIT